MSSLEQVLISDIAWKYAELDLQQEGVTVQTSRQLHDATLGSVRFSHLEQQDVQGHPPSVPKLDQHNSNAAASQSITENRALLQARNKKNQQGQWQWGSNNPAAQQHNK